MQAWLTFTEAFEKMKQGEWFMPAMCYLKLEKMVILVSMKEWGQVGNNDILNCRGDYRPDIRIISGDAEPLLAEEILGRSIGNKWIKVDCTAQPRYSTHTTPLAQSRRKRAIKSSRVSMARRKRTWKRVDS